MNWFNRLRSWWRRTLNVQRLAVKPAEVTDDNRGWTAVTRAGTGPSDRSWSEHLADLTDALEAWRVNAWVRQVVRLTTAYVVGDVGEACPVSSNVPAVQQFIGEFWDHPENRMGQRLAAWCDELTRSGELFPVLFTNKISGMSQVRAVPASCIEEVLTDPEDYEKEIGFAEVVPGQVERRRWKSWRTARARGPAIDGRTYRPEPVMLHYGVNRVVGATRGESDLTPLLPWAQRYTEWLKERALFNRLRNKMAIMWVKVADPNQVEQKRADYEANPPEEGAVHVTGPDEEISFPNPNLQGFQAEPDGKVLRLAMATAANLSLVHFGEGDTANLSTTVSMDDRTFRTNRQRQQDFAFLLSDLVGHAYRRYRAVLGSPVGDDEDLGIGCKFPDISRSDNKDLAVAAKDAVVGLRDLGLALGLDSSNQAWREFAFKLALKFAGEILSAEEIKAILGNEAKAKAKAEEKSPKEKESNGPNGNHNGTGLYTAAAGEAGRGAGVG